MAEAEEVSAFIRNAEEQLVDAEVTLRSGRYHLSFLCSALSAENASSATSRNRTAHSKTFEIPLTLQREMAHTFRILHKENGRRCAEESEANP
ncbi:MAG: hypothetical protein ACTSSA_15370 [Candidatus Freyarchaeota archaeon]